jgi:hypothetical protein
MNKIRHKISWYVLGGIGLLLVVFITWQEFKKPPSVADWQPALAVMPTATFNGNFATVHNVRNFRYDQSGNPVQIAYYDKTYDLTKLTKVWYLTDPFKGLSVAAHTFVSFEFSDGNYLSVTIEARLVKGQQYNLFSGILHSYPIMYIAADEKDAIFVRANINKDQLYMYPVKLSKPENGRLLFVGMLQTMDDLAAHPAWYNTLWANCTSSIAYEINRVSPGRLSYFSWQLALTGYADKLALKAGLLDTNLPLAEARDKYYISTKSQQIGYVPNYSQLIRQ